MCKPPLFPLQLSFQPSPLPLTLSPSPAVLEVDEGAFGIEAVDFLATANGDFTGPRFPPHVIGGAPFEAQLNPPVGGPEPIVGGPPPAPAPAPLILGGPPPGAAPDIVSFVGPTKLGGGAINAARGSFATGSGVGCGADRPGAASWDAVGGIDGAAGAASSGSSPGKTHRLVFSS